MEKKIEVARLYLRKVPVKLKRNIDICVAKNGGTQESVCAELLEIGLKNFKAKKDGE